MSLALEFYQLQQLQTFFKDYLRAEYLRNVPNRLALMQTSLGKITHYWTHEPKNNPEASHLAISRADLEAAYADALMMFYTMVVEDNMDIGKVTRLGVQRLRNLEWKTRCLKEGEEPVIKCGCGKGLADKELADLSGWIEWGGKWTCPDCAVDNLIDAKEM